MKTVDTAVLTTSEDLEAFRLSTLARLHTRFEERAAFARKAIGDLEELLRLAGIAQDPEVETELAAQLELAREELSRVETLLRETEGGAAPEPPPANGKAQRKPSPLEGWWKHRAAEPEPVAPREEQPADDSANGEGALKSSWGWHFEATPAPNPSFEARALEETSGFDFTAMLGVMEGKTEDRPGESAAPAEEPLLAPLPVVPELDLLVTQAVEEDPWVEAAGQPAMEIEEVSAVLPEGVPVILPEAPLSDAAVAAAAPAVPVVLELSVTVGHRTQIHAVATEMLVGRRDPEQRVHPDLDLFPDAAVSRRHGQVFERGGEYYYRDLDSLNGTQLNGRPVPPRVDLPLSAGDELVLGEQSRIVMVEAAS